VDKILEGTKPGDLPVEQPTKFELVINLTAATIASFDYPGAQVGVNFAGARLGAVDEGQGPWQGGWAIAASPPVDERFGITGEVSGLVQRGTSAQAERNSTKGTERDRRGHPGLTHRVTRIRRPAPSRRSALHARARPPPWAAATAAPVSQ